MSLSRSLYLWSGHSDGHGWNQNNMAIMDWTGLTWSRQNANRHGGHEEWNPAAMVSSKYFTSTDCISVNWPGCSVSGVR